MNESSIDYHLAELELATKALGDITHLPEIQSSCRVLLDVGCGIGQSLVVLGQGIDIGLFGVDVDAEAVAFGAAKFPHLRLSVAKGESLPFADEFADMVLCRVALPYMNIPVALQEFRRVLRPGGALWLSYHPLSMFVSDFREAVGARDLRSVLYRSYALLNGLLLLSRRQIPFPFNRQRMESYQSAKLLAHAMRKAGFTGITHRANTIRACS